VGTITNKIYLELLTVGNSAAKIGLKNKRLKVGWKLFAKGVFLAEKNN